MTYLLNFINPNKSSLELNSRFNNKFSNNLVVGYTAVNDDRNPIGKSFPAIEIRDGSGTIFLGSEAFSTANLLLQKTLTVTDNFQILRSQYQCRKQ